MRIAAVLALVLALVACRGTSTAPEAPGPEHDPVFTLPLTPGPEVPPIDHPRPPAADAFAYEFTFRFLSEGRLLSAPVLTVESGLRAEIRLVNQVSYIADFDVEVTQDAFVADPVVSILTDGMILTAVAAPEKGGTGIVLAWRIELTDLARPIRTRRVDLSSDPVDPAAIQLPAITARTAAGRVLLTPGVETSLVSFFGEEPVTLLVRAAPVHLVLTHEVQRAELNLEPFISETGTAPPEPEPESEPDALLDDAADRDPPAAGQRLHVALGTMSGSAPSAPLHLEAGAAERFLSGLDLLREAGLAAAPEAGAGIAWLLRMSYHRDSAVRKAEETVVLDPDVDTIELGFTGRFGIRDGEPVLAFTYSVVTELRKVPREKAGVTFAVERPVRVTKRGVLRLRGAVDVMPIGRLEDGRTVVLVVRRAVPR